MFEYIVGFIVGVVVTPFVLNYIIRKIYYLD